eukprot:TRINITY_DN12582_c0_g1_i1.p1 TRINITY_DN12582_c0_g1~~TRINITY_DN12582_c0_g1_i1.p1  ORF type:complete len:408 (+),score=56.40 TRINITY_DN12582_c0_g1_i1:49-1224(+)
MRGKIPRCVAQRQQRRRATIKAKYEKDPDVPVPSLHAVGVRVKDIARSITFWKQVFGWEVMHVANVDSVGFTMAYIGPRFPNQFTPARLSTKSNLRTGKDLTPQPGTMDAHDYVFHNHGTCLKLIELQEHRYNHRFTISDGNTAPHLGFGGIGVLTENLDEFCRTLHVNSIPIVAEPSQDDDSVLIKDPNGYAVRIAQLNHGLYKESKHTSLLNTIHACRVRVKNPEFSLFFYEELMGMKLICKTQHPSLPITRYYLCTSAQLGIDQPALYPFPDPASQEALILLNSLKISFLELQHHHGTESREDFEYHSGNSEPVGFANINFMVENVDATVKLMLDAGIFVIKNKGEGAFPQSAYFMDPDGYWVEVYPRCMRDFVIVDDGEDRSRARSS